MTVVETEMRAEGAATTGGALPPIDRSPLRRRRRGRMLKQLAAVAISLFMGLPVYLIALAAFSSREALREFPKSFLPTDVSVDTLGSFLTSTGIGPASVNSLTAGLLTVLLSLVIGAPSGYALARYGFRGKDAYQVVLLLTRALPIVVLSIPLAQLFLRTGTYDTVTAVVLIHTALALPTTVLITSSIFVSVPRDVEEAALIFGCSRFGAFLRVVMPLAVPGLAASSVFTFVLSWNEVLGAAITTLDHRTLPAQVLASLEQSSLAYRFAGGFLLVVPSLVFIALMRRYLLNMWGKSAS